VTWNTANKSVIGVVKTFCVVKNFLCCEELFVLWKLFVLWGTFCVVKTCCVTVVQLWPHMVLWTLTRAGVPELWLSAPSLLSCVLTSCTWFPPFMLWSSYDHTWFSGPDKQAILILILAECGVAGTGDVWHPHSRHMYWPPAHAYLHAVVQIWPHVYWLATHASFLHDVVQLWPHMGLWTR
jgi:hypothetical protein